MTRIAIVGAAGRMGKTLIDACHQQSPAVRLTAAVERVQSGDIGRDAGIVAGISPQGTGRGIPPHTDR